MKILLIAALVALICASSAFAAMQIARAVSDLDAPGTFFQNKVQLRNGSLLNCVIYESRRSDGPGLSCDWARLRP
jgi:hypothetical protein